MEKSFTLTEITITVAIILILATLAIVGYSQVLDNTYQRVCAINQMLLLGGTEQYFLDTGVAPATLGDIKLEHLRDVYVEVMADVDWFTKFSYFFVKLNTPNYAYAQIDKLEDLVKWQKMQKYGIPREAFQCPADRTPEGISYGINTNLRSYSGWKDVPSNIVIIGDCNSYTFSSEPNLDHRHIRNFGTQGIAQAVKKDKKVKTSVRSRLRARGRQDEDKHEYKREHKDEDKHEYKREHKDEDKHEYKREHKHEYKHK